MYVLGKEILIYPRNDVHIYIRTYLPAWCNRSQIIMYICTYLVENPQIIMRTYLLGREILIDPRNNVHMYLLGIIDPR